LKTDKNGEIQVKNLLPGKYYLVETKTLTGYEKYDEQIEIQVGLNEKYDVTVNNIKEVKKEVEKPKEEEKTKEEEKPKEVEQPKEENPVVKKLPKTGM